MKRKLAAFIMAGCLAAGVLTGCGGSSAAPEVDASQNADLSEKVTDGNNVADTAAAYQEFLDAQTAMEGADSAKIATEMLIGITADGQEEKSKQHFDISRSTIDDKPIVEFVMKTGTISGEEGEEESLNEIPGYFYDGRLYFSQPSYDDSEGSTDLSEEMTYEDLMSIIGSSYVLNDLSAEYVESAAEESKNGGKQYIFILDNDKMVEYMSNNLAASGVVLSEDEGVVINYANVSADIDSDGMLTAYTFSVDAVINDSEGETPFRYNIASVFTSLNKTNVKVRTEDELEKYIDVQEYTEQMMAEQEQAAAEAETGELAEAVTEETETEAEPAEAVTEAETAAEAAE